MWTVLFSILAVLSLNACGDSNNVTGPPPPVPLSPDAKLSSLTVTSGPLQPAFSSDVRDYAVDVGTSVTSVTVTARGFQLKLLLQGEAGIARAIGARHQRAEIGRAHV